jgi:hypothetical protein
MGFIFEEGKAFLLSEAQAVHLGAERKVCVIHLLENSHLLPTLNTCSENCALSGSENHQKKGINGIACLYVGLKFSFYSMNFFSYFAFGKELVLYLKKRETYLQH